MRKRYTMNAKEHSEFNTLEKLNANGNLSVNKALRLFELREKAKKERGRNDAKKKQDS